MYRNWLMFIHICFSEIFGIFFTLKSYTIMIAIANYYGYPYDMNTTSIQLLLNIVQLNGY